MRHKAPGASRGANLRVSVMCRASGFEVNGEKNAVHYCFSLVSTFHFICKYFSYYTTESGYFSVGLGRHTLNAYSNCVKINGLGCI